MGGRQPFRKTSTSANLSFGQRPLDGNKNASSSSVVLEPPPDNAGSSSSTAPLSGNEKPIFGGLKFLILGEAKSPSVKSAIESCSGTIVPEGHEDEDEVDFIIVRLVRLACHHFNYVFRSDHELSQR